MYSCEVDKGRLVALLRNIVGSQKENLSRYIHFGVGGEFEKLTYLAVDHIQL
jgi:hypothetical protein